MVMFGALGKRRGPFDPPETYQTPGIGDGLPGATPMADVGLGIPMPQAPVAAAMDKPKFGAWDAVGAIGDGLQALGGGQGTYLPLLLRQNQERQRAAQATQQAQAERNDWLWKETWKRDNPAAPAPNDTERDFAYIEQTLGKPAAMQWLKNKTDPVVSIPVPGGTYLGPRSGVGTAVEKGGGQSSGGSTAPQGAIEMLRGNPSLSSQFDAKYGQGASAAILGGGAVSNGGGNFPDPLRAPGHMTSGRRTVEGNRLVGGKPNSHHLTGDAADYTGTSIAALRQYFGPGARFLDEGDHIHTTLPGYRRVPLYGKQGTR